MTASSSDLHRPTHISGEYVPAWLIRRGRAEGWLLNLADIQMDGADAAQIVAMHSPGEVSARHSATGSSDDGGRCANAFLGRMVSCNTAVSMRGLRSDLSKDGDLARIDEFSTLVSALCQIPPHPNVLRLFGMLLPNLAGVWQVIGEHADGCRSLREYISARERDKALELAICKDMASGLCALHSETLAHGDLSPDTVFVTSAGLDRVTAKIQSCDLAANALRPKSRPTHYSAPEANTQSHACLGAPADVYSYGLLLLFVFSGLDPPSAAHGEKRAVVQCEEVRAHGSDACSSVMSFAESVRPLLSSALLHILRHCFEPVPSLRPRFDDRICHWIAGLVGPYSAPASTEGSMASGEDISEFERGCLERFQFAAFNLEAIESGVEEVHTGLSL